MTEVAIAIDALCFICHERSGWRFQSITFIYIY